jgi:NADH dehydrogenase [ubiquinone] 1 alpha subcomplex assembly factor 7
MPGTIIETCPGASAVMEDVALRIASQGGGALFIDYGYAESANGSSLQAVRAHQKVDPFTAPGEADLTALVDFAALVPVVQGAGCRWLGTVPQGQWLRAMGIDARTEALSRAVPDQTESLCAARDRLTAPEQMGDLFKVFGLTATDWPEGAGF